MYVLVETSFLEFLLVIDRLARWLFNQDVDETFMKNLQLFGRFHKFNDKIKLVVENQ